MAKKWEPNTEYSQKLKDPKWQQMRLRVMERDEWTCHHCGDKETTLNVHHTWYAAGRDPWEYPDASLLTLCESCHEWEGEWLKESTSDVISILKHAGATASEFNQLGGIFAQVGDETPMNHRQWATLLFVIHRTLFDPDAAARARDEYAAHLASLVAGGDEQA